MYLLVPIAIAIAVLWYESKRCYNYKNRKCAHCAKNHYPPANHHAIHLYFLQGKTKEKSVCSSSTLSSITFLGLNNITKFLLATSKNVLIPCHNHLLTTDTDNPSFLTGARAIIKVSGHQYQWLWPGNSTFLEVASMVISRWIVGFFCPVTIRAKYLWLLIGYMHIHIHLLCLLAPLTTRSSINGRCPVSGCSLCISCTCNYWVPGGHVWIGMSSNQSSVILLGQQTTVDH